MNRRNRREAIFADDEDRRRFLATLTETCAKTGWQVHAYCLMPNHFHLVITRAALSTSGRAKKQILISWPSSQSGAGCGRFHGLQA